eukprot:Partr_v1_DN24397_c0_g2_i2_m31680 putative Stores iron in a soluble, non-toxic, readily available form. Important for iron homeostasis (By similarity)
MSLCKQNFAAVTEEAINSQINAELQASHTYMSLAAYFGRDTVALRGLEKYFKKAYEEEREHGEKLIKYQNMRGGKVAIAALTAPDVEWKSARNAVEVALQMEKDINSRLLKLHQVAESQNDSQLCDFIEGEFLGEQVEAMKRLADMLTNLSRVGNDGLGLFLFDKELLDGQL